MYERLLFVASVLALAARGWTDELPFFSPPLVLSGPGSASMYGLGSSYSDNVCTILDGEEGQICGLGADRKPLVGLSTSLLLSSLLWRFHHVLLIHLLSPMHD